MLQSDTQVKALAFVAAFCAVLSQATDLHDPKTWAAAIGAGCAAMLALMRQVGAPRPPEGGQR